MSVEGNKMDEEEFIQSAYDKRSAALQQASLTVTPIGNSTSKLWEV